MTFEILYLNKIRQTMPIFGHILYKWFGIETALYKSWWKLYSAALNSALRSQNK